MLATLGIHIEDARTQLANHKGEIKMRRLNRREYNNSVYHLLGFKVSQELLPEDIESENFDTVGEDQFFTSRDFEDYLTVGTQVTAQALKWLPKPHKPVTTVRHDPSAKVAKKYAKIVAKGDAQMAMKKAGKSWEEMGFKDAGSAKILFSQFNNRIDLPRKYLELPQAKKGVYLTSLSNGYDSHAGMHYDPRANYKFKVHGGYVGNPTEERKIFRLENGRSNFVGCYKFTTPSSQPSTIETNLSPVPGNTRHSVRAINNYEGNGNGFNRQIARNEVPLLGNKPWASIWIDWVEFEGPFYPEQVSELESILFPDGRSGESKVSLLSDKHAKELIRQFAYFAFRRQEPESHYVDMLYQYFRESRLAGKKYPAAIAEAFSVILSSPKFLYIVEPSSEPSGNKLLSSRELAIRLSFYLWSSPPDDKLYAADLRNPIVFSKQVDRMLADPRSNAFRDGFISQWAELQRYDAITINKKIYKQYSQGVHHSAKQEVKEFFGTLITENLPAKNLIDSDFITINPTLANHYGIVGLDQINQEFSKVQLAKDSPRGGLTTQAAFLTLGSNGERSSPVIRGAFLQEKLLHDKPLPPPPNVPELGSSTNEPLTNRQLVKLHQQQKVCSSCHETMDAIGFGLENFDAIGRWRDFEKVKGKKVAIDPSSALPDGSEFKNVQELKDLLMLEKDLLARELVESMLSYALGRTVQFSDEDDVDTILKQLKGDDYKLGSMIKAVALSPLFKRK